MSDSTPDTGPRWTVDGMEHLCFDEPGQPRHFACVATAAGVTMYGDKARAALVQCVRDVDRLAKARDLAARAREANSWIAHQGGLLDDLLDLLTEAPDA